jgi:hypothetical protein
MEKNLFTKKGKCQKCHEDNSDLALLIIDGKKMEVCDICYEGLSEQLRQKTILKVPAMISRVQTMADGGLRLFVDTQEIGPGDKGLVMELHKKIGWFLFAEQELKQEDILDLPEIQLEAGEKPLSQTMRGVLFRLWEKAKAEDKTQKTSEGFYRDWMSRAIEKLKEGLD